MEQAPTGTTGLFAAHTTGIRLDADSNTMHVNSTITAGDVLYGEHGASMATAIHGLDNRVLNLEVAELNPNVQAFPSILESIYDQGYSGFELEQALITLMNSGRANNG